MNALIPISRRLAERVDALRFPSVAYVYDPLVYAREAHEHYLTRFGAGPKRTLLLGMNPGPFGMAQTGVPFGDVAMVRDYLGITGALGSVPRQHPKRPIEGFACPRSEVSGTRLWGYVRSRFPEAQDFFSHAFVWNYCPLAFVAESGANLTPDKLPASEQAPLLAACDDALREVATALQVERVVGVGAWAEKRARLALPSALRFGTVLHPSPASPAANRGWAAQAEAQLVALEVFSPFRTDGAAKGAAGTAPSDAPPRPAARAPRARSRRTAR